jgi:predicted acyltransferase
VFRGLTVALMILVNNPGSWSHIHPPLRHAAWHGLTPTDLVFPFFLFIVGVAVSLSFARRGAAGATRGQLVRKIAIRSVIIFSLGLFLNGFPFNVPLNADMAAEFTWSSLPDSLQTLRIPGVLQRIALCYLLAALTVVLTVRLRHRVLITAGFLVLYEMLMRLPLVTGWGGGSFEMADNFVRWADLRLLAEAHLHRVDGTSFDPEGLVSTLPAVATTMAGFFTGEFIRGSGPLTTKLRQLFRVGSGLVISGLLLCRLEPVNKQLWTVSYVVLTGGLAMVTLVLSSWMMDVRKWRTGTLPAVVFGSNPLVVFVGSGILARILVLVRTTDAEGQVTSLQRAMYEGYFVPLAGPVNGSFLFALTTVFFWLGILWFLYRRELFIKI